MGDKFWDWIDSHSNIISGILLILLGLMTVGLILLLALSPWLAPIDCHTTWKDSGYESRYISGTGCQIKTEKGWIPEKNFRITK